MERSSAGMVAIVVLRLPTFRRLLSLRTILPWLCDCVCGGGGGGGEGQERGGKGAKEREKEEINHTTLCTLIQYDYTIIDQCPSLTSDEALFVPSDSKTLNSVLSCLRI